MGVHWEVCGETLRAEQGGDSRQVGTLSPGKRGHEDGERGTAFYRLVQLKTDPSQTPSVTSFGLPPSEKCAIFHKSFCPVFHGKSRESSA